MHWSLITADEQGQQFAIRISDKLAEEFQNLLEREIPIGVTEEKVAIYRFDFWLIIRVGRYTEDTS